MGMTIGRRCDACGAEQGFRLGAGWRQDLEGLVGQAGSGDLGPAVRVLLGRGIPDGWNVFRERASYRCPSCDAVIPGEVVKLDDGGGCLLTIAMDPGPCPKCGEELVCLDDREPMGQGEVYERCEAVVRRGCPACGGADVSLTQMLWD